MNSFDKNTVISIYQTDRYMMFELYQLEKMAKDAYGSYRFPQGCNDF